MCMLCTFRVVTNIQTITDTEAYTHRRVLGSNHIQNYKLDHTWLIGLYSYCFLLFIISRFDINLCVYVCSSYIEHYGGAKLHFRPRDYLRKTNAAT